MCHARCHSLELSTAAERPGFSTGDGCGPAARRHLGHRGGRRCNGTAGDSGGFADDEWGSAMQRVGALRDVARRSSEAGMATAEYAIVTLAACGFAGLLMYVLRSGEVRALLAGIIRDALAIR
jgi:uncharacterized protein DUF4244